MKHILITGVPGIGKTTLTKKLIKRLADSNSTFDGFTTEELRNERFQRTGFAIRLIKSGVSSVLADKTSHPPSPDLKHLGQYTVYVKNFENFTLNTITSFDAGLLVVDEIGKMELFSKKFEDAISTAFSKERVRILATVPIKGPLFVEQLKKDSSCQLITSVSVLRGDEDESSVTAQGGELPWSEVFLGNKEGMIKRHAKAALGSTFGLKSLIKIETTSWKKLRNN